MGNNYSNDKTVGAGVDHVNVKFKGQSEYESSKNARKSSHIGASQISSLKGDHSPDKILIQGRLIGAPNNVAIKVTAKGKKQKKREGEHNLRMTGRQIVENS